MKLIYVYTYPYHVADGSSMLMFPLVLAESEQDMPGIKPGLLPDPKKPARTKAMLAEFFSGNCKYFGRKERFIILHRFLYNLGILV